VKFSIIEKEAEITLWLDNNWYMCIYIEWFMFKLMLNG